MGKAIGMMAKMTRGMSSRKSKLRGKAPTINVAAGSKTTSPSFDDKKGGPNMRDPMQEGPVAHEVYDAASREEIYRLRVLAWKPVMEAQGRAGDLEALFPDGRWQDPGDARMSHWAIRKGGPIIAASGVSTHDTVDDVPNAELFLAGGRGLPGRYAYFGRLVVHPSERGSHYARQLMDARRERARALGCRTGFAFWWKASGDAWLQAMLRRGYLPLVGAPPSHVKPFGEATPLQVIL